MAEERVHFFLPEEQMRGGCLSGRGGNLYKRCLIVWKMPVVCQAVPGKADNFKFSRTAHLNPVGIKAVKQQKAVARQGTGGVGRVNGIEKGARTQMQQPKAGLFRRIVGKGAGDPAQFQGGSVEKELGGFFFRMEGSQADAHFGQQC